MTRGRAWVAIRGHVATDLTERMEISGPASDPAYDQFVDRRTFLQGFGAVASLAVIPEMLGACGRAVLASRPRQVTRPSRAPLAVSRVDGLPVAAWLVAENARRGTLDWVIDPRAHARRAPIEGYADRVSVAPGQELSIFVNTRADTFRAEVYRMGYYSGLGARLVTRTKDLRGRVQPGPVFTPGINRVACDWQPSYRFAVTDAWPPGNYLIRLSASSGRAHFIPVTVRDDASRAAIVVQNSVTTWQAYNRWGGYSLYGGTPINGLSGYESRSRVVSFDRPYENPDAGGSGDWLGNEFPFLYLAERHGLDLAYLTNLDIDENPALLDRHRVLVSLGHDEYWSWQMRYGVQAALLKGLNVAFLGANACYRQIRFGASTSGPRREVICYKDYLADPVYPRRPWLATGVSWATTPGQTPESQFIGAMYQNFGASGDLEVYDPSAFVFRSMGLARGSTVHGVIGSEFDAFEPRICPHNVQILAHSPTRGVSGYSDMTYYTTPHGGGVFDSGTADFVTAMWNGSPELAGRLSFGVTRAAEPIGAVTLNLLRVFADGPAARSTPSRANWSGIYRPTAPLNLGRDQT